MRYRISPLIVSKHRHMRIILCHPFQFQCLINLLIRCVLIAPHKHQTWLGVARHRARLKRHVNKQPSSSPSFHVYVDTTNVFPTVLFHTFYKTIRRCCHHIIQSVAHSTPCFLLFTHATNMHKIRRAVPQPFLVKHQFAIHLQTVPFQCLVHNFIIITHAATYTHADSALSGPQRKPTVHTTMTWGIKAADKRSIVPTHIRKKGDQDARAVIVDATANLRNIAFDIPTDDDLEDYVSRPPKAIANILWRRTHRLAPNADVYVFCFDDYSKLNDMRKDFYERGRYAKTDDEPKPGQVKINGRIYSYHDRPLDDEDIPSITHDYMPPTCWARAWNNTEAKYKLFDLFAEYIMILAETHGNNIYIVHDRNGNILTYPPDISLDNMVSIPSIPNIHHLENMTYGEGDLKMASWALAYASTGLKTICSTIDGDAILTLALHEPDIDIHMWSPYIKKDAPLPLEFDYNPRDVRLTTEHAIRDWGKDNILRVFEIADMAAFKQIMPDRHTRLRFIALLSEYKTDYTLGLDVIRYTRTVLNDLVQSVIDKPHILKTYNFVTEVFNANDPGRKCLMFNPKKWTAFLRRTDPYKKCTMDHQALTVFNQECLRVVWNLRYMLLHDMLNTPGGPPKPDWDQLVLFPNVPTLNQALYDPAIDVGSWLFYEIAPFHPTNPPPWSPLVAYHPAQAKAVAQTTRQKKRFNHIVYMPLTSDPWDFD